jgi:hypothetical protein
MIFVYCTTIQMSISNELDNLAKLFKIHRLNNELNYYKNNNNNEADTEKIEHLTKTVQTLENEKYNIKNKIQNAFEEIDKMVYKCCWKKLPEFHKTLKLKEYLDDKYSDRQQDREIIEKILLSAIKNKSINNNDCVTYDPAICKITDIPVLKSYDGKYKLILPSKTTKKKSYV